MIAINNMISLNHLQFNESFNTSLLFNRPKAVETTYQEYLFTSAYLTLAVALIAGLMSFCTIVGNVLVITAFIIDKNLRKYSNYFILNLSFADLLIGLLIPPYAPFLLYNYNWKLGRVLCTVWLVLDYVVGSASVLCIVVISLDRYWLVSRGLAYISAQKISRAIFIMATCWFIAFFNYAPAIVFWELFSPVQTDLNNLANHNHTERTTCQAGFHNNLVYLTVTACVEFFLPFISICSLNLAVYLNIRKRSQGLIRTKMPPVLRRISISIRRNTSQTKRQSHELTTLYSAQSTTQPVDALSEPDISINEEVSKKVVSDLIERDNCNKDIGICAEKEPLTVANKNFSNSFSKSVNTLPVTGKKDKNLKKDKKAARSLFILVFTFVVCWAPYTFLTLVRSVCQNCIKDSIYEFTFWLLWFNSTLNPILYPFLHVQFRKAFTKIFSHLFCCMCCRYRNGVLPNRHK